MFCCRAAVAGQSHDKFLTFSFFYYVISKKTMDSLPEEYQKVIREVMAEYEAKQYQGFRNDADKAEATFTENFLIKKCI